MLIRRLPVFFLLDVSESMAGDEIYQMEQAVREVLGVLRRDPHCLETVHVSVIAFAGRPRTLVPLVELVNFVAPELPLGGGTGLGAALNHLMAELDQQVTHASAEVKGDWKPLVFLVTDGHPTDAPSAEISRWVDDYSGRANLVAVSVGGRADNRLLRSLTPHLLIFDDTQPDAYKAFVDWVSQSVRSQSASVALGKADDFALAPGDDAFMREFSSLQQGFAAPDRDYVVIVGRCERTNRPYLAKFAHVPRMPEVLDLPAELSHVDHALTTVVPLRESYFELTESGQVLDTVDMNRLLGAPACPHCGAEFALAVHAQCGNAHCVSGPGMHTCPWCGVAGLYDAADAGESLEVHRAQG